MNSNNLKKTYAKTYEKFFLENQTVISAPFVMNRSGDILNNYSGVSIKQKIPLRIYIGYSKSKSKKIAVTKIYHLDVNEYQFIESNALEYAPYIADINKELENKYMKLIQEEEGIDISIFSELPRGAGLGFGSILALLISMIIHALSGTIDHKKLSNIRSQNINELMMDGRGEVGKIFADAFHFDKIIYGMVGSGTKMASFFDASYPIVSFSEDCDKTLLSETDIVKRYYGFRLNELFPGLRENPYLPIDYGLVYSGKPVLLEQIAGSKYRANHNITKTIKSDFQQMFGDHFSNLHPQRVPRFYKYLIAPEIDEFDAIYGKLMGIVSLKILYFMSKIYAEAYEETHMLNFLDELKKLRQADCVTRNSSSNFMKFIKSFLENFRSPQQYLALAPNDSTIMGGSLIFAVPLEGFRKIVVDAAEKTGLEFVESKLIYANRIDGVEYQGVIYEQDVHQGLYSEFLDSRSCILKTSDGKIRIGQYDSIMKEHTQGILLDMINNKIYINGRKLTSEDLHSQTATADILQLLIKNISKDISNKDLQTSSYSKNKNDMQGKIVLPLIELVHKELGKKLPLICKGSLYEFYIKLNPSDIEMAIIENIDKTSNA